MALPKFFRPSMVTGVELQTMMASGKLKSAEIIEQSLAQVRLHDGYLKALLEIAPDA